MSRCLNFCLLLLALYVAATAAQFPIRPVKPEKKIPDVDNVCMNCICQASSNCDETIKCHNAGGNSYFCGPYVISWAYWHDSGRPGDHGKAHDFETCLTNRTCAEQAVRGYMRKHGQDCDKNGEINCDDFVRIHKLGFGACGGDAITDTEYWQKYDICYYGYPGNPEEYPDNSQEGKFVDYGEGSLQARNAPRN